MNILLVSRCTHRALTETRRILDQFAERRGENVWQTPITQAGLDTLRRLLRKTARRNTAVACHWIRGRDHSELIWIVGNALRFNERGAAPTHTTRADVLRSKDENSWHSLRLVTLLTGLAALLHDLGKACRMFQGKLLSSVPSPNVYRHEWITLRLLQAFVGDDDDAGWLRRLAELNADNAATWLERLQKDGFNPASLRPFISLPPLARAVAWLCLTHHRLPMSPRPDDPITTDILRKQPDPFAAEWNNAPRAAHENSNLSAYWEFTHGLPTINERWRQRVASIARELPQHANLYTELAETALLDDPYVMHQARLVLMLADHAYSSLPASPDQETGGDACPLFANTRNGGLNQRLDEHLLGVEKFSRTTARALPRLSRDLPRLARHKGLTRRSRDERYNWQNTAAEAAAGLRERGERQGAFIINMASTGCGKTFANVRIMNALSNPFIGMRCAFALGLRTLTRQTGKEYRKRLYLHEDEVAILAGGTASGELYDHAMEKAEQESGSASAYALLPEDTHVIYEGNPDVNPVLNHVLRDPAARKLLAAPLLCCTIDHLIPATEGARGGRHILPTLRLQTGDLVLDELDDYDIADLHAVTRLVFWAGLWGSRVLLSSATLPPALARGMFEAYRQGRAFFQRNRGERPLETPPVCCLWVDEHASVARDCPTGDAFALSHAAFTEKRAARLVSAPARRRAEIRPLVDNAGTKDLYAAIAANILHYACELHERHNEPDPHSGKRVSFGLIRLANIEPLFEAARALFAQDVPEGFHVHLCVYHSRFPLLLRSAIEERLDKALRRHTPGAVFNLTGIRRRLDAPSAHDSAHHIFIVLGSPVTEVGRDHDYDWAIVEPSSMRSIIQIAGRVCRHRNKLIETSNIILLDRCIRSLTHPGEPAYHKPGFETDAHRLAEHNLKALLAEDEYRVITSRPRIVPRKELRPRNSLTDLEHYRLDVLMRASSVDPAVPESAGSTGTTGSRRRGATSPDLNAASCWAYPRAMLSGLLQQVYRFRKPGEPEVDLILLPNEDETDYTLTRLFELKNDESTLEASSLHLERRNDLPPNPRLTPWGKTDYMAALLELAHELDMSPEQCARRYGTVTLPVSANGWRFHPILGFSVQR